MSVYKHVCVYHIIYNVYNLYTYIYSHTHVAEQILATSHIHHPQVHWANPGQEIFGHI